MKTLLLFGGGGHCRACIDVIEAQAVYKISGIVTPSGDSAEQDVFGYPIVGCDDDIPALMAKHSRAFIAVGQIRSPEVRIRLFDMVKSSGAELPIVQSPWAYCSRRAVVGEGSILMHKCVVNANARIGANCIINSHALVEHDVEIADNCHIATGARVNGDVRISKDCFVGSGAILREGINIGSGALIGAGQVVLHDVPPGAVRR